MKKVAFLFMLLDLIFFSGCAPNISNLDSGGKNIICFGDSITSGEGVGRENAYPEILSRLLGREVINAGYPGDTSFSALSRLEKEVLKKSPYLVIVELGGNDFLHKIRPQKTFENIERIVRRIQEERAIVVLCDISCGLMLSRYRKRYKKIASKYRAIFVPHLFKGILDNPSLKIDYLHPNKEGHRIIAQRIFKILKKYRLFKN